MAAPTTINVHLNKEKVEVSADLQYLEPSDHRYWSLTVVGYGEGGGGTVTLFLSPDQLVGVKNQLEGITDQLRTYLTAQVTRNA